MEIYYNYFSDGNIGIEQNTIDTNLGKNSKYVVVNTLKIKKGDEQKESNSENKNDEKEESNFENVDENSTSKDDNLDKKVNLKI